MAQPESPDAEAHCSQPIAIGDDQLVVSISGSKVAGDLEPFCTVGRSGDDGL
jgi:hypothetical protein